MSRTMRMLITVVFAALMSLGMATVALADTGDCSQGVAAGLGPANTGGAHLFDDFYACSPGE